MSMRTHQIHVTKTVQLVDLNDNENKCIVTFNINPSDITVTYDVAVVSQNTIDSSENWQDASTFKRFSGNVTNTVEIDDDSPQGYYLAFRSSPNTAEEVSLNVSISSTPLQAPAQQPAVPQPVVLESFEDEIVKAPWYKTTWGILIILTIIGLVSYFGYRYWISRQSKDVKFKPLVEEKTIPSSFAFNSRPVSRPEITRPTAPRIETPIIPEDTTVRSEYKAHKYRSRDRIKPDFSKPASPPSISRSPPRSQKPASPVAPPVSVPAPSEPAPSLPPPPPVVETPAPVVERTPEIQNKMTSKLFEKLRSGITMI